MIKKPVSLRNVSALFNKWLSLIVIVMIVSTLSWSSTWAFSAVHQPARISVGPNTIQSNNWSLNASLSSDGRFVAFDSDASNLVANDTNGIGDVFVYDRQSNIIERISVDSNGVEGDSASSSASISPDGRYVTFFSMASNLVSWDTNGVWDIFVHDRQTDSTTRVSIDSNGNEGNGVSSLPSIASGGRYVAYHSTATNLVANDTNAKIDVFMHDRVTGTTTRVSIDSNGVEGNNVSWKSSISPDGNFIAYLSNASNLVSWDTNGVWDVFLYDRINATTTRISVDNSGAQATGWWPTISNPAWRPSLSDDGRYIAFWSHLNTLVPWDTNSSQDIFVRDTIAQTTTRVSVDSNGTQWNGFSDQLSLSPDGRYVAFRSYATDLVTGDTNGRQDIFVHDRQNGTTTRASVDSNGIQADRVWDIPSISSGGQYVAFSSLAYNLVASDTNNTTDIFIRDTQANNTTRTSLGNIITEANNASQRTAISEDGRYVAFVSDASNLVTGDTNGYYDFFVHDRQSNITTRISVDDNGNQGSDPFWLWFTFNNIYSPSMSDDGRYIVFASDADNLVSGDNNGDIDIFLHDSILHTTTMASVSSSGTWANGTSLAPFISHNGRYITFASYGNNLVTGDTNGRADIFVHDRQSGTTTRASVNDANIQWNADSLSAVISDNGRYVALWSFADNLITGDNNGTTGSACPDVFVRDTQTSMTTIVSKDNNGTIGNSCSYDPSISADGRYIAFASYADNLVANDNNGYNSDVFVHDMTTQTTIRASVDSMGTEANSNSYKPSISSDGRYVAFTSDASNIDMMATLWLSMTWSIPQAYIYDMTTKTTNLVSAKDIWVYPNAWWQDLSISADGQTIAWSTDASDIITNDTNSVSDIYVTSSYIDVPSPAIYATAVSLTGWSNTWTITINGTGLASESLSIIMRQYNTLGTLLRSDIYTSTIDTNGEWSVPIGINVISGSIDIIASLYDATSDSSTARKVSHASLSTLSLTIIPAPQTPSTPTTNVTTVASSYGWGGGWGWLTADICPNGDNSWSLYDGTCGIAISMIPTVHPVTTVETTKNTITTKTVKSIIKKCYYSDGKIPTRKIIYSDVIKSPYKNDIMKLFTTCTIQWGNQTIYDTKKLVTRGELLKIALRSERVLPKSFNQNAPEYKWKVRWEPYMNAAYKDKKIQSIVAKRSYDSVDKTASKNDISMLLWAINPTKYNTINLSGKWWLSRWELAHIVAAHLD